jgi:hypothetical protein
LGASRRRALEAHVVTRPISKDPTHRYLWAADDRLTGDGESYTVAVHLNTVKEAVAARPSPGFQCEPLSSRERAGAESRVALLTLLIATRMEAKAGELFPHCDTGDAKPAGGLGLVTFGQLNRLGE